LVSQREVIRTQKLAVKSLEVASVITSQRSCADLVLATESLLPEYLGFEGVGLMFRDTENNGLFSLQTNYSDDEIRLINQVKEKKKIG